MERKNSPSQLSMSEISIKFTRNRWCLDEILQRYNYACFVSSILPKIPENKASSSALCSRIPARFSFFDQLLIEQSGSRPQIKWNRIRTYEVAELQIMDVKKIEVREIVVDWFQIRIFEWRVISGKWSRKNTSFCIGMVVGNLPYWNECILWTVSGVSWRDVLHAYRRVLSLKQTFCRNH